MTIEELTEEEVKFVLEHSDFSPETYYAGTPITNRLLDAEGRILSQHLKGVQLIELGPGHRPQVIGDISEYIGVEPLCPVRQNINYAKQVEMLQSCYNQKEQE